MRVKVTKEEIVEAIHCDRCLAARKPDDLIFLEAEEVKEECGKCGCANAIVERIDDCDCDCHSPKQREECNAYCTVDEGHLVRNCLKQKEECKCGKNDTCNTILEKIDHIVKYLKARE